MRHAIETTPRPARTGTRWAGIAAVVGGALGVALAPIMVMVKYRTGWSVIPKPAWIDTIEPLLAMLLSFASPVGLWVTYGSIYTVALVLMFAGLIPLTNRLQDDRGRSRSAGLWIMLVGFCLVIPGDAIHTATWHQNGLTTPTPGTNVVANTAYAVHMMGMNLVMIGSLVLGVTALRRRLLARWLAWAFVLMFPSAVLLSLTFLPTTPSGALSVFSLTMVPVGGALAAPRFERLLSPALQR